MEKHRSGIGMNRWNRLIEHMEAVRKRGKDNHRRLHVKTFYKINMLTAARCCPISVLCNYERVLLCMFYEHSDTIWWTNLSSTTRQRVLIELAFHFGLEKKFFEVE